MISNLKKHVGVLANTGVRVAVVFRKIPTDETFCLVVETERLPDSYHDYLVECTNSKEAAETNELYEVLNRRYFPDGTNCLTSLNQRGFLRKEPVSNVTMIPLPGHAVPLELINATIDKKLEEYETARKKETGEIPPDLTPAELENVAKGLIIQANLLEEECFAKREEAYAMAPHLRPTVGRPRNSDEERLKALEAKKARRNENNKRKTAEARIAKKKDALDAKINEKILRDAARQEANATIQE